MNQNNALLKGAGSLDTMVAAMIATLEEASSWLLNDQLLKEKELILLIIN